MTKPRDYGPAYATVGIRPRNNKCRCGQTVRFDIVARRLEHFMVCPAVNDAILANQAPLIEKLAAEGNIPDDLMGEQGDVIAAQVAQYLARGQ